MCAGIQAAAHALPASANSGWSSGIYGPPGFETYNLALTYDSADGYLLLFGSIGGLNPPLNGTETWTYAGGVWTQLHPANGPESCPSSALAYDSVDHYVVYFGGGGFGGGNCSSTDQTWMFHAGVWSELHPTTSPSARDAAALTNDSGDGYLLLFGGFLDNVANHQPANDTWSFVGGVWTKLNAGSAPVPRSSAGLTYDPKDGYALLFGGAGVNGQVYADTWSFSGGTWRQLFPAQHPFAPWPDGLAYDASDAVAVYTSAENRSTDPEQVWTFTAGNWTQWTAGLGNTGVVPPNRLAEATAYDWHDAYFVLFGGSYILWQPLNDFWSFHKGNWTELSTVPPSPREGAAGVYDAADGYFMLFGGANGPTYFSDTWKWVAGTWTKLTTNASPPARAFAGLTYDASDGYVLLFGGGGASQFGDTWEFTNGGWTKITPATSPPSAGAFGDLVYDAADGYVVLLDTNGTSTWAYHAGVWTDLTGVGHPAPPYPTDGIVYDAADARVVLFGTSLVIGSGAFSLNDTWTFLNGNWTNITAQVGPAPAATWYASMTYDVGEKYVLLFGGSDTSGVGLTNATWSFVADHWTLQYSPVMPQSRYWSTLGYDAASGSAVLFGGYGAIGSLPRGVCVWGISYGDCGDTWVWSPGGVSTPTVRQFTSIPNPVDLGSSALLSVDVYGGVSPYSYVYTGLPTGCASADSFHLACTPAAVGTYSVTVQVTDSAGNGTSSSTQVRVVLGPNIIRFSAVPASLPVGLRTLLSVQVGNGTPPFGYSYSGLPTGCSSQSVPTLPCTPWENGTFDVTVTATDASNQRVSAQLNLTVTPAGGTTGPGITSYGITPAAITLGNSTTLFVNAQGAAGSLTFAYSGLPPGCGSANRTPLQCTPTSAGVFAVSFFVVAPSGGSTAVEANLTVYPVGGGGSASISAFGASPGIVVQGNSTVVTVEARGGTGPLTYGYPSLPPGCRSENSAAVPCTPTQVGNFTIRVVVTDALGNRTGARALLTVVPALTRPPPSGHSGSSPAVPYLDWLVGGVIGLAVAIGLTDTALRRRRAQREGNDLVRAFNEEAENSRPRPPVG